MWDLLDAIFWSAYQAYGNSLLIPRDSVMFQTDLAQDLFSSLGYWHTSPSRRRDHSSWLKNELGPFESAFHYGNGYILLWTLNGSRCRFRIPWHIRSHCHQESHGNPRWRHQGHGWGRTGWMICYVAFWLCGNSSALPFWEYCLLVIWYGRIVYSSIQLGVWNATLSPNASEEAVRCRQISSRCLQGYTTKRAGTAKPRLQ